MTDPDRDSMFTVVYALGATILVWIVVVVALVLMLAGCATAPKPEPQVRVALVDGFKVYFGTPDQVDHACRDLDPRWTTRVWDCAFLDQRIMIVPHGTSVEAISRAIEFIRQAAHKEKI